MKQQLSSLSFADLSVGQRKVKQAFFSQIDKIRRIAHFAG